MKYGALLKTKPVVFSIFGLQLVANSQSLVRASSDFSDVPAVIPQRHISPLNFSDAFIRGPKEFKLSNISQESKD